MQNPVYTLVSEALARVVSERAADHMLRAALRDARLSPDGVSAEDMQRVLAGPLENRLLAVMPPGRARHELSALAERLHTLYPKAPTLFPEAEPTPTGGVRWNTDAMQSVDDWDALPSPVPVLAVAAGERGGAAAPGAGSLDAFGGDLVTIQADAFDFDADDFVLDDPEGELGPGGRGAKLPARGYDLSGEVGQDALLSDLARFDGVQGVVLCDASGKVLRARAARGTEALGAVMAATAALLSARPWRILCADLGAQNVCVKPLASGHFVALLTGGNTNLGRLIAELSVLKESA